MTSLATIAERVRAARGMAHKTDIAAAVADLGIGDGAVTVGDDCAAIPDGDGWLLFAIEGFLNDFVEADPRFAGYCGLMVNLSDIAAMGGRPLAVVDAIWAKSGEAADPVLAGLREASQIYGVPIVGGHTNMRAEHGQLAVAILGRAKRLITSFDAKGRRRPRRPRSICAAAFRGTGLNWDAATGAPPARLRGDLEILPELAEAGLVAAGKDISMAGLVGTAMMAARIVRPRRPHRDRRRALPRRRRSRQDASCLPELRIRALGRAREGRRGARPLRRARYRLRRNRHGRFLAQDAAVARWRGTRDLGFFAALHRLRGAGARGSLVMPVMPVQGALGPMARSRRIIRRRR